MILHSAYILQYKASVNENPKGSTRTWAVKYLPVAGSHVLFPNTPLNSVRS